MSDIKNLIESNKPTQEIQESILSENLKISDMDTNTQRIFGGAQNFSDGTPPQFGEISKRQVDWDSLLENPLIADEMKDWNIGRDDIAGSIIGDRQGVEISFENFTSNAAGEPLFFQKEIQDNIDQVQDTMFSLRTPITLRGLKQAGFKLQDSNCLVPKICNKIPNIMKTKELIESPETPEEITRSLTEKADILNLPEREQETIAAQFAAILRSSRTNIVDRNRVARIAFDNDFFELVNLITDGGYDSLLSNFGEIISNVGEREIPRLIN